MGRWLKATRDADDRPGGSPRASRGGLAQLLRRVTACRTCPTIPTIYGYRKFPPSAAGRRQTRFALVGEAPGIASIENRRQWTGTGGLILRREIRRLGLDLEDLFYLTNAVKCWPAARGRSAANRSPLASEARRCRPFLLAEMEILRPEVIVAVGGVAARALLDRPIRLPDDHGRRFVVAGREVVVLLHPANASRHRRIWPGYRASLLALFAELAGRAGYPIVPVTAAVVERGGRYLVTLRPAGQEHSGTWEFPGGKRAPGESLEGCLRRELAEELGVDARVGELLAVVPWPNAERRLVVHFFRSDLGAALPVPREGQHLAWLTPEEILALALGPADAEMAARLHPRVRARW